jgi:hypothetical protein
MDVPLFPDLVFMDVPLFPPFFNFILLDAPILLSPIFTVIFHVIFYIPNFSDSSGFYWYT